MACKDGATDCEKKMNPLTGVVLQGDGRNKEVYCIPSINFGKLEAKLDSIARRCKRLGFPEPSLEIMGTRVLDTVVTENGQKAPVEHYDVALTGCTPVINGWAFSGKLEHEEGIGTIVKDFGRLPESEWNREPVCDHCNTKRNRKNTFILQNVEDGTFMQVGRSCLKDFTGANDPHLFAEMAEFMALMDEEPAPDDDVWSNGKSKATHVDATHYLACVTRAMSEQGKYVAASDNYGYPTADNALDILEDDLAHKDNKPAGFKSITTEEMEKAQEILEWTRNYYKEHGAGSGYEHNLEVLATPREDDDGHYFSKKNLRIAATIVLSYERHQQKSRESIAKASSQYVGEVKVRQDWEITCTDVFAVDNYQWGKSYIHKFSDPDGNQIVWQTKNRSASPGKTYEGKGTVKKHAVFNDIKETHISRAKLIEKLIPLKPDQRKESEATWDKYITWGLTPGEFKRDDGNRDDLAKELPFVLEDMEEVLSHDEQNKVVDLLWRLVQATPPAK